MGTVKQLRPNSKNHVTEVTQLPTNTGFGQALAEWTRTHESVVKWFFVAVISSLALGMMGAIATVLLQ